MNEAQRQERWVSPFVGHIAVMNPAVSERCITAKLTLAMLRRGGVSKAAFVHRCPRPFASCTPRSHQRECVLKQVGGPRHGLNGVRTRGFVAVCLSEELHDVCRMREADGVRRVNDR